MDILKKNFKNKFIILTLCFTIIFSSINIKKSYADFVISPIMLATVSALAVGTGIALSGADDLYDIGRLFVDYVNNNNSIMWDTVQSAFHSSVAFNHATKQVTVGKDFGSIVKGFFDKTFGSVDKNATSSGVVNIGYKSGYPDLTGQFSSWYLDENPATFRSLPGVNVGSLAVGGVAHYSNGLYKVRRTDDFTYQVYNSSDKLMGTYKSSKIRTIDYFVIYTIKSMWYCVRIGKDLSTNNDYYDGGTFYNSNMLTFGDTVSLPYNPGTYNPGNVWGDTESGEGLKDIPIYVPGNLGDLVGSSPGDIVGDKAPGWVGNGTVSVPGVDNPSIGLDGSTSFPQTDVDNPSIPGTDTGTGTDTDINTGIWATIKDFIISLVVPSDTFWTDTWNGLYSGFVSAFPGVDMDNFNSLVTGEKKFPNIDINIMGVKGRVVNGDVINSIVDWLRPIIAGFMMLCLMFFNYRKIYKLIRNSEPFGRIAPGTSDFSTGISEYSDNLRVMTSKGGK